MTTTLLLILCVLILLAYAFDLTSKFTRIPTVIFLFIMGIAVKQITLVFDVTFPNLSSLLPPLGTVGLILIVLEGGLDLELNKSKKRIIAQSFLSALFPIIVLGLLLGIGFSYYSGKGLMECLVNALPICVISSAIAIPSVQNLVQAKKEFIVYESSMSDIIGVMVFNFFVANEIISLAGITNFVLEIIVILLVSLVASVGLAFLIKKIDHHVKFIPIIVMVLLIYFTSKIYHLPALVFILIFGLLLNNLDELKNVKLIARLKPKEFDIEVGRFREIVVEIAFLVRTMFFLLFGFLIDVEKLADPKMLLLSLSIVVLILLVRFVQFKISKVPMFPLLFVAPRGLITILLYLSIPVNKQLSFVNETLIIQIILITAIVMMLGLMFNKKAL